MRLLITLLSFSALLLLLTYSTDSNAGVYKCKTEGRYEYRDTPCYYQNQGDNKGNRVKVKPTAKSGTNIKLNGLWCQYATATSKHSRRSVVDPKEWVFRSNGSVEFYSPVTTRDVPIRATYTIASDYLQTSSGRLGSWFVEDYQENTLTLSNTNAGVRYLKRGRCSK
ncbi:hypothetical protein [Algibacillus agarilyticus]|uniref:hypothetical protein n=1 Tax=Algibacillus agarilyticus TaxID=2234133 RepID=UPI000DD027EF|nr:hypothetical protein [Algibacillus agarilyticus]